MLGPLRPGLCDLARSNPTNTFLPRNKVQGGYCRCVRAQIPPSPKSATPRCPGLFAKRPPLPPPPPSVLPVRAPVADTYPLEYRRMRLVHPLPGGGPVSKVHGGVLLSAQYLPGRYLTSTIIITFLSFSTGDICQRCFIVTLLGIQVRVLIAPWYSNRKSCKKGRVGGFLRPMMGAKCKGESYA